MAVTSGAGLASCAEAVFLAQRAELPVVLLHVQHLGGSQGGARLSADADAALAGYLTPLGSVLPVLVPCDPASALRLTQAAFRIADDLRTPVVILASEPVLAGESTVPTPVAVSQAAELALPKSRHANESSNPKLLQEGVPDHLNRRARSCGADSRGRTPARPLRSTAAGAIYGRSAAADRPPPARHRIAHGRLGFAAGESDAAGAGRPLLNVEPQSVTEQFDRLRGKIAAAQAELEFVAAAADPDAHTLLVSYGLADGSARQAVAEVRRTGGQVSHLTLHSLWPLPRQAIRRAMTPFVRRVLVVEANAGLYAEHLQRIVPNAKIESLCGCDARSLAPASIVRRITDWPCG